MARGFTHHKSTRTFNFPLFCLFFGSAWLLVAFIVYQHTSSVHPQHSFDATTDYEQLLPGQTTPTPTQDDTIATPSSSSSINNNKRKGSIETARRITLQQADQKWLETHIKHIVQGVISQSHSSICNCNNTTTLLTTTANTSSNNINIDSAIEQQQQPLAVPRLVDRDYHQLTYENIPGVEDVHSELQQLEESIKENGVDVVNNLSEALTRQKRKKAIEVGLEAWDMLEDIESMPTRLEFLDSLYREAKARQGKKVSVAIASTISFTLQGIRRELLPWLQYHTELGVTKFYLLYDSSDQTAVHALQSINHVDLIHIHPPWATPLEIALVQGLQHGLSNNNSDSDGGDIANNNNQQNTSSLSALLSATSQWENRPGNFELMVKQGHCLEEALRRAKTDGIDWLLHLDPDELMHIGADGGGGGFSGGLPTLLGGEKYEGVPAVRFMNFEGQPEIEDVVNRFEQVTLFRAHKHFITPEAFYWRNRFLLGHQAAFLNLYANGKSAVRVNAPGVQQLGPHFFGGNSPNDRWITPTNPQGVWRDAVSDDTVVLHYAYSYLSDVKDKSARSCPREFVEAAKLGDVEKVKSCFVIDFDRDAFLAANGVGGGEEAAKEFYYSRMVLAEGSPINCGGGGGGFCALKGVDRFKYLMGKLGLYRRFEGPQVLLKQHERLIQLMLKYKSKS